MSNILLLILGVFISGCGGKSAESTSGTESKVSGEIQTEKIVDPMRRVKEVELQGLYCGKNLAQVVVKIVRTPLKTGEERYAIVFNGSPGTVYLGDSGGQPALLVEDLINKKGYNVIQVKYSNSAKACGSSGQMEGFYSACCAQGLPAVVKHNEELYHTLLKESGYESSNHSKKKLIGIGLSLGTLQLTKMAFKSGLHFDSLAMLGLVLGDVVQGCSNLSWLNSYNPILADQFFSSLADSITTSTRGCTQKESASLEYTSEFNFDQLPFKDRTKLGLFDGRLAYDIGAPVGEYLWNNYWIPKKAIFNSASKWILKGIGVDLDFNPARYIYSKRDPNSTFLKEYDNCGHNPWACAEGEARLNADILQFLGD